jgi:hypothetical protein
LQLFLGCEKRDLLRALEKLLWKDASSVVSNAVDSTMQKALPVPADDNEVRLQTPPLVDLIIRLTFQRRISLEESMIEVRNMEGAQQFRDLLAQVQQLMMLGDRAAMIEVKHLIAPLIRVANKWSADPKIGLMWQARVSKLPWIGDFLDAVGI